MLLKTLNVRFFSETAQLNYHQVRLQPTETTNNAFCLSYLMNTIHLM